MMMLTNCQDNNEDDGTDVNDADEQGAFDDHNSDKWEQNDDDSVKVAASPWVQDNLVLTNLSHSKHHTEVSL